jgi:hypothetical protein
VCACVRVCACVFFCFFLPLSQTYFHHELFIFISPPAFLPSLILVYPSPPMTSLILIIIHTSSPFHIVTYLHSFIFTLLHPFSHPSPPTYSTFLTHLFHSFSLFSILATTNPASPSFTLSHPSLPISSPSSTLCRCVSTALKRKHHPRKPLSVRTILSV